LRSFVAGACLVIALACVNSASSSEAQDNDLRLRIGIASLDGQKRLDVTIETGSFRIVPAGLQKTSVPLRAGQHIQLVVRARDRIVVAGEGVQGMADAVRLEPQSSGSSLRVSTKARGRTLAGALRFTAPDSTFMIVDELLMEDYLMGVVPAEMFPSWEMEALKSQAILARTYTAGSRPRHENYDLCDRSHCQVYLGLANQNERTDQAVQETRGLVLAEGTGLARIFYHSTCGGATALAQTVFRLANTAGTAPMQSVSDYGKGGALCASSPHFRWEYELDKDQFQGFLQELAKGRGNLGRVTKIRILDRDVTGRVDQLELVGSVASCKLAGTEFRTRFMEKFGDESLKSTLFALSVEKGRIVFRGRGYGHGVGLCQWGAEGLAELGQTYRKILSHYYPNSHLARVKIVEAGR
jgi:stage II sporulation protein D